jgi:hypothetical protein
MKAVPYSTYFHMAGLDQRGVWMCKPKPLYKAVKKRRDQRKPKCAIENRPAVFVRLTLGLDSSGLEREKTVLGLLLGALPVL